MTYRLCNSLFRLVLCAALASLAFGCPDKNIQTDGRSEYWQSVTPGKKFTLLVIGDAEIAKKINQVAGTWEELTQASLIVEEMSIEQLLADSDKPKADAVVCPIQLQATLVAKGYPAAISSEVHLSVPDDVWSDLLDTYKHKLSKFGPEEMFIPFGSQFFVCYYRVDLLQKLGAEPPKTWEDYENLQKNLQEANSPNWRASLEPTAPGWAAKSLLARAASYVTHRDYYSTVFDAKTMKPLIAAEPFVRALTEMCNANPLDVPRLSPSEVRSAFWQGKAALAITYPTSAEDSAPTEQLLPKQSEFKAGIAMIPGSLKAFNPEKKIWDDRWRDEPSQIPTLISGHVGMISAETSEPASMLKLLLWLSGEEWGTEVFASSPQSGIGRNSEVRQTSRWVEKEILRDQSVQLQYVTVLNSHWKRDAVFVFPPLPGYEEYMNVLDREVRETIDGKKEPQAALNSVADEWQKITEKYGIESQQKWYRRCCGMTG
ncbi:MAG: ABC transporter substrate-binding protein [Planctomycetaceae bacterium]|jgi:multiple sugar transport system substrate-binding protein|nr:ABC transporter substrate-binding protein [Planctomycetaceae bacterium]